MSKLVISANSKFDARRAIELANLVQRAYEQFNCHKEGIPWEPETFKRLTGSTTCDVDLNLPSYADKVVYDLCAVFHVTERTLFDLETRTLFMVDTVPFGFIAQRKLEDGTPGIFIVFRGTLTTNEWLHNAQFQQEAFLDDSNLGLVSSGFQKIYTSEKDGVSLQQTVAETLKSIPSNAQIFVTGHSLGGALATLATVHIATRTTFKPILYSYASPRVGDPIFAAHFEELEHYRIANSEDLVPAVPPSTGRLMGPEMYGQPIWNGDVSAKCMTSESKPTPSMVKNKNSLGKLAGTFRRDLSEQVYQHAGEPLYFTDQRGFLSTNHNMFDIYRRALPDSMPQSCEVELLKHAPMPQEQIYVTR